MQAFSGLFCKALGTRVPKASTGKARLHVSAWYLQKPSATLQHVYMEKECTNCIHPCTCYLATGCLLSLLKVFLWVEVFLSKAHLLNTCSSVHGTVMKTFHPLVSLIEHQSLELEKCSCLDLSST